MWTPRRHSSPRCDDTERLLRSGRAHDGVPVLSPGAGARRAEEAMRQASARLSEAQRLLAAFRDRGESDLREAYCAVHAAKCDLAAVRHWRAVEAMMGDDMGRSP